MGNKPSSVSEGEDEEERAPLSVRPSSTVGTTATGELTNGGGDEPEEELELPPPMKPIQEPILVGAAVNTQPPTTVIEENPCKRVSTIYFDSFK